MAEPQPVSALSAERPPRNAMDRFIDGIELIAAFFAGVVAVEWAPYDIRVNCVAPGTIRTSAFNYYSEAGRASFDQANPMLHPGDPWDVAEAILYVASPAGKFITGEVLNFDGGQQSWGDPWFGGRPPYFELDYTASRQPE